MFLKNCVTNGTGFIGRRLADNLEARDLNIHFLTRINKIEAHQKQYFIADRVDKNILLAGLMDGVSVVYYCAGEIRGTKLNAN